MTRLSALPFKASTADLLVAAELGEASPERASLEAAPQRASGLRRSGAAFDPRVWWVRWRRLGFYPDGRHGARPVRMTEVAKTMADFHTFRRPAKAAITDGRSGE